MHGGHGAEHARLDELAAPLARGRATSPRRDLSAR
jgi:hypothetical protein